jgi:hypothetical protein
MFTRKRTSSQRRTERCRELIGGVTFVVALLSCKAVAFADGGAIQLSQREGNYQITLFTEPTPLRAGPVDVSVLVLNAETGDVAPDVKAMLAAAPNANPEATVSRAATAEAATNKLFRAATFDLPAAGKWHLTATIDGPLGTAQVHADVKVGEPLPQFLSLWPWLAWPIVPVLLYAARERVVRGRRYGRAAAGRPSQPLLRQSSCQQR